MSGVTYDCIVAGGGTAGSVLAARLSEDGRRRVLLLEAGPDYPEKVPAELLDGSAPVTRGHNWDLQALVGEDGEAPASEPMKRAARVFEIASGRLAAGRGVASGTRYPYPMGRVVGGGSAVNGGLAFHARPEDFAAWVAAGNDGWSWEEVRPFIARVEQAGDGKPALPIEVTPPGEMTRLQRAFYDSCLGLGHAPVDLRQGTAAGVGAIPRNVRRGRRVSAAETYLAAARKRPNLTIRSGCLVDRLVLEGGEGAIRATGVEAVVDGARHYFPCGQVVLAAGAIHSPLVLLRSGIGAAAEIARVGGEVRLDLPGVGKGLTDHPAVGIWGVPRDGACSPGESVHQAMLQLRSSAGGPLCDLQLYMLSALPTEKMPPLREVVGGDLALGISVVLATPRSRGRVELLDRDPARRPRIYLNCLREADDMRRMMEGLRSAWRVLREGGLGRELERVVVWSQSVVDSDSMMEKVMRSTVRGAWHPAGTLRMGRAGDPEAVVDPRGRLFGSDNIAVADGSIMPALPSVPPNLTCMLIAERIAADLFGLGHA